MFTSVGAFAQWPAVYGELSVVQWHVVHGDRQRYLLARVGVIRRSLNGQMARARTCRGVLIDVTNDIWRQM